ncbi:MAG: DUF2769 domain-containing protein [Methanimicrococcus sp.]|nr:DUF2769 domain-containing protein [Methanimicrococcus sp.]
MKENQTMGKYFGVCASFHHSKACLCKNCRLRPEYGNIMYCAKGRCPTYGSGDENGIVGTIFAPVAKESLVCLCSDCFVYKQFAMAGLNFCEPD